uniref:Uncharacterized protein n=1 Tax=Ananas comosus var. bracteatus TaxID=296719 RepID=A0A6V7NXX8_ANACO|nr:unnamed protein product [Ananas comosus var. bracteatus]
MAASPLRFMMSWIEAKGTPIACQQKILWRFQSTWRAQIFRVIWSSEEWAPNVEAAAAVGEQELGDHFLDVLMAGVEGAEGGDGEEDIDANCLKIVKEMIIASSNIAKEKSAKEKLFLYDIVANGRTGIDVDKLLESMRVMDNEICYPAKEYLTIHKLFATRADLHRTVYTHAKVKVQVYNRGVD